MDGRRASMEEDGHTPSQRNKQAGQGGDEDQSTSPVERPEPPQPLVLMFDLERTERKWYGNKGEDAEGDIDPENPMPVALCQRTPDHRTGSAADSPLQGDDSEPLPSLAEGHHVLMKFELVSALRGVMEHKNTEIRSFISHFIKQRRVAEEFEQCLFRDISSFEKLSRLMQIARYVYWVKSPALAHSLCSGPIAIRLPAQYEKGAC